MRNIEQLKLNIGELIKKYSKLQEENIGLKEKVSQTEKDLNFHLDRNQELPELALRNKKLLSDREKIAVRIDNILKKLEEVQV